MKRAHRMSADAGSCQDDQIACALRIMFYSEGNFKIISVFLDSMCFNRLVNMSAKFQANMNIYKPVPDFWATRQINARRAKKDMFDPGLIGLIRFHIKVTSINLR